jgi:hypothetical protein
MVYLVKPEPIALLNNKNLIINYLKNIIALNIARGHKVDVRYKTQ